jgi:hypothetical protein
MSGPSQHRTLAVFDMEGFSARNSADQRWLRDQMYELVASAAERAAVPSRECDMVDRGDGVALLVRASVSKEIIADAFIREVVVGLRAHNRRCHGPAAMRMRLSLHAGEVVPDGNGWVGTELNMACRLVDAEELRDVLRATPEAQLAICVSNEWFRAVIQQNPDLFDPQAYTHIAVTIREIDTTAWVRVPGYLPAGRRNGRVVPTGWSRL